MTLLASGFLIGMLLQSSRFGVLLWQPLSSGQANRTTLTCCLATGPSGFTVREIIRHTEADIKSWTDKCEDDITRPTRTFIIEVLRLPPGSPSKLSPAIALSHGVNVLPETTTCSSMDTSCRVPRVEWQQR